ncbi:ribonuclease III [Gregarina niphandrodes]|uniref:Ribonuclease III n=1 Tax=Gregarina niphandrodes TaxID=110365 RepID=A0A023B6X0_GRENI|nr:ribonuclease III [Gregarina niphandrodes]EZG66835.1 ribonuclease III [Gregarina niphandrodes]|eukprot:XP_011130457.1 ribonuclease III [Gregarina niphandrodes]
MRFDDKVEYVESLLGYRFNNRDLIERALTHRSMGEAICNQKLEWLGDSVLQLAVSDILYERYGERPDTREGDLVRAREMFVRGDKLRALSKELQLQNGLITANGVSEVFNEKMSEDLVESILGAIFIDGGYAIARTLVKKMFKPQDWGDCINAQRDSKSELQEFCAKCALNFPSYAVVKEEGPMNSRIFNVQVTVMSISAAGAGTSKMKAEQAAASVLLEQLKNVDGIIERPTNAKSRLLELCHKMRLSPSPAFFTTECRDLSSPIPQYKCVCVVTTPTGEKITQEAIAGTKKAAEKEASHLMYISLFAYKQNQPAPAALSKVCPAPSPKVQLINYAASNNHSPVQFTVTEQIPCTFKVECAYPTLGVKGFGCGQSKKEAELNAAERVLERLKEALTQREMSDMSTDVGSDFTRAPTPSLT